MKTIVASGRTILATGKASAFPKLSESKAAAVWLAKVLNSMKPIGKVQ